MLSCLHILKAYLLTRRMIQALFCSCASILEKSQVVYFQLTNLLCESRLLMTFTKFNEFSYASTVCYARFFRGFFYLVCGSKKKKKVVI